MEYTCANCLQPSGMYGCGADRDGNWKCPTHPQSYYSETRPGRCQARTDDGKVMCILQVPHLGEHIGREHALGKEVRWGAPAPVVQATEPPRPEGEELKAEAQIFYAADILGNALKSDHRRSPSGTYMKLTYAEALEVEKALAIARRAAPPLDAAAMDDAARQQLQVILSEVDNCAALNYYHRDSEAKESRDAVVGAVKRLVAMLPLSAPPLDAQALAEEIVTWFVKNDDPRRGRYVLNVRAIIERAAGRRG